jgi:elongation factor 1-beta
MRVYRTIGCEFMARVLAQMKIFPTEANADLKKLQEQLSSNLPADASILKVQEEPIAFGLVALIVTISMAEKDGLIDQVEKALASTPNVGEVQTVAVGRT